MLGLYAQLYQFCLTHLILFKKDKILFKRNFNNRRRKHEYYLAFESSKVMNELSWKIHTHFSFKEIQLINQSLLPRTDYTWRFIHVQSKRIQIKSLIFYVCDKILNHELHTILKTIYYERTKYNELEDIPKEYDDLYYLFD